MFYFTELLMLPVLGGDGHYFGRLRDLIVEPERDPNLVQMVIYRRHGQVWQLAVDVAGVDISALLVVARAEPVPLETNAGRLLLQRDVLDQQIIDVNGRKVVRVNDVGLEVVRREHGSELRAISVEVGLAGALRRLVQGAVPRRLLKPLSVWAGPHSIPWQTFDLVEVDPARRMRLQITYDRLSRLHPADAADIMEELPAAERDAVFSSLDRETAAEILPEVNPRLQKELLEHLDSEKAADVLEAMEPDERADILTALPAHTSDEILEDMEAEEREEVADLLEFDADTAGGRMTTDLIALPPTATVADALAAMRGFEGEIDRIHAIFLVNADQQVVGAAPLVRIALSPGDLPLAGLASDPVTVNQETSEKDVAELFDKYNLLALPVVDDQRKLVGMVTVDDVITWLRAHA